MKNTYSVSLYLRRKKVIYCTININGFSASRSTKIEIHDHKLWIKNALIPSDQISRDINSKISEYLNNVDSILKKYEHDHSFTPAHVFDYLEGKNILNASGLPLTVLKAIDYYITTNDNVYQYSNHTRELYKRLKLRISEFFREKLNVEDYSINHFTSQHAKQMKMFFNERGYSGETQRTYLAFMKSVCKLIIEDFPSYEYPEFNLKSNPFASKSLRVPKKETRLTEFIYPHQEKALWDLVDTMYEEWKNDYVLLCLLMFNSGISFGDCGGTHYDVIKDFKLGDIFTYSRVKSGESARIVMYDELEKVISLIRSNQIRYKEKYNNWLPVNRFQDQGEYNMKVYREEYNRFRYFLGTYIKPHVGRNVSAHTFRHSFAVKMLEKGHSLDAVKVFMGHSSIMTTEKHYGFILDSKILKEKEVILNRKSV